jgi:hypothetical protein
VQWGEECLCQQDIAHFSIRVCVQWGEGVSLPAGL